MWVIFGSKESVEHLFNRQIHQELDKIHSPNDHNIVHFHGFLNSFFPAKEDKRTSNSDLQYKQKSPAIPKCPVNPNPGSSEIICNSSASHPSQDTLLPPFMTPRQRSVSLGSHGRVARVFSPSQFFIPGKDASIASGSTNDIIGSHRTDLDSDGFLKGWNENWENFIFFPNYPRIDKLLDRDHVWVVTQTMVIFEYLALWALHALLTYKVYPGFWGRANLYYTSETGLMIQDFGHQTKVIFVRR